MRELLIKLTGKFYNNAKSNPYLKKLYYTVANRNFFSSYQEHEKMLGDKSRIETYYKAIQKHVNKDDTVIDLGTGTGILSFFASQKSPAKIFAIEHGNIIEAAKKTAAYNGITNIEFVNLNSKDFKTELKADIIIHEQIGAFLFDENMTDNLIDLRNRVLKKDGKILPGKFEFFVEPVQIKENERVPYLWEQNIHGIKYDCFSELKKEASGAYGAILIRPDSVEKFTGDTERLLFFDIEKMDKNSIPDKFSYKRKVKEDCVINGLIVYFNIIFDDEIMLTTSPFVTKTHWNIPLLRTETIKASQGDILEINFEMKDPPDFTTYSWSCRKLTD